MSRSIASTAMNRFVDGSRRNSSKTDAAIVSDGLFAEGPCQTAQAGRSGLSSSTRDNRMRNEHEKEAFSRCSSRKADRSRPGQLRPVLTIKCLAQDLVLRCVDENSRDVKAKVIEGTRRPVFQIGTKWPSVLSTRSIARMRLVNATAFSTSESDRRSISSRMASSFWVLCVRQGFLSVASGVALPLGLAR